MNARLMTLPLAIALLAGGGLVFGKSSDPLVVHEWGTFTALQDERGKPLGRINTDDEPVPAFVHQVAGGSLFPPTAAYTSDAKGVPAGDPAVTMRLETPVLYFHPPKGHDAPITLDIDVVFRGGWLTQYFPDAQARIDDNAAPPRPLTSATRGRLSWHSLIVNPGDSSRATAPETHDPVWTAPRAVRSAAVVRGDEREQFLFYRGVGNLEAPLHIVRDGATATLKVQPSDNVTIAQLWLVDVRPDGALAYRALPRAAAGRAITTPAEFASREYSRENLSQLRSAMRQALVGEGLFADEADALLNTWRASYFQSPGQRLFFLVPQNWTDAVLPLSVSVPAEVTRVMVGRIELVTPAQRALLQRMAQTPAADLKALKEVTAAMTRLRNDPARSSAYNALAGGHGDLKDLGVPVPQVYADFLALGRFRTALLLAAEPDSAGLAGVASVLAP